MNSGCMNSVSDKAIILFFEAVLPLECPSVLEIPQYSTSKALLRHWGGLWQRELRHEQERLEARFAARVKELVEDGIHLVAEVSVLVSSLALLQCLLKAYTIFRLRECWLKRRNTLTNNGSRLD